VGGGVLGNFFDMDARPQGKIEIHLIFPKGVKRSNYWINLKKRANTAEHTYIHSTTPTPGINQSLSMPGLPELKPQQFTGFIFSFYSNQFIFFVIFQNLFFINLLILILFLSKT
jgi:hypothetical protein